MAMPRILTQFAQLALLQLAYGREIKAQLRERQTEVFVTDSVLRIQYAIAAPFHPLTANDNTIVFVVYYCRETSYHFVISKV